MNQEGIRKRLPALFPCLPPSFLIHPSSFILHPSLPNPLFAPCSPSQRSWRLRSQVTCGAHPVARVSLEASPRLRATPERDGRSPSSTARRPPARAHSRDATARTEVSTPDATLYTSMSP